MVQTSTDRRADALKIIELSILYEISSLRFSGSEEIFGREVVEIAARLFGARRLALFIGTGDDRRLIASLACRDEGDISNMAEQNQPNKGKFALGADGSIGTLYIEQEKPIDNRQWRLYNILARQLEQNLELYRETAERKKAEEELRKHLDHLEELVEKRTAELKASNEELQNDITARKQAESKLQKSEQLFSSIFHSAGDGLVFMSKSGKILDVNEKTLTIYGGPREELLGKHFTKIGIFSPRIIPEMLLLFKAAFTGEQPHIDFSFKNKLGEEKELECTAEIVRAGKKILGLTAVIRDVTERKKAEKREILLAEILENAPFSVVATDEQGNITHVNHATERLYGYKRRELVGKNPVIFNAEPDAEAVQKEIMETVRRGKVWRGEILNRKKGGELFYIGASIYRLTDTEGNVISLVGFQRDITERKQMEEAVKESENKYQQLLESLQEGIWAIDKNANTTYVNQPMADMLGYSPEEMLGKHLFFFMDEKGVENASQLLERRQLGIKEQHEFEFIRKDGTRIYALLNTAPIIDEKGRYIGAIAGVQDITERKRMEEALRESEERFRIASQIASDVVYERDIKTGVATFYGDIDSPLGYEPGGYSRTMEGWRELVHPEDLVRIDRQGIDQLKPGVPYSIEYRMRKKDGTYMTWLDSIMLVNDAETGEPLKFIGAATDITERKQMEEALRESEEHHRALVEASNQIGEAIIRVQDTDKVKAAHVFASPEWARITGYSLEELKEISYLDLIHPRYRDAVADRVQRRLRGENIPGLYEISIVTKDGREVPVEVAAAAAAPFKGRPSNVGYLRDITERKKAEEALRESEARLAELYDEAPVGYHELDSEGRIVQVNRTELDMLGYTAEEMLGRHVWDFIVESDVSSKAFAVKMAGTIPAGQSFERTFRRKDGTTMPALIEDRPVRDENGQLIGLRSTMQDITERKRAEEETLKFKKIADIAHYGVGIADADGTIIYANEALALMHGYSPEEIIGQHLSIFYTEEQLEAVEKLRKQCLEKGSFVNEEVWRKRKDGSIFPGSMSILPVRDDKGKTLYMSAVVIDITERKQWEEDLKESEERYRALVNLGAETGEAVVMLQDDERGVGMHIFASEAWSRITGYSVEELLNLSMADLIHPRDRAAATQRHSLRMQGDELPGLYEISIIKKDGTEVPVEVTYAFSHFKGKRVNVGYIRDITRRKQAEEALQLRAHLLNNASDSIVAADLEGNIIYANDTACITRGYTKEEMLEMNLTDTVTPQYAGLVSKRIERVIKSGYLSFESEHVRRDGSAFPVEITSRTMDLGGKTIILSVMRDITERKKAEEELRESEERYRAIFELGSNVGEAIIINQDIAGQIGAQPLFNDEWVRITGYSRHELLHMSYFDLIHPAQRDTAINRYYRRLHGEKTSGTYELTIVRKDGTEISIEATATLTNFGGQKATVVYARDITERKKAETALKESEEFNSSVLRNSPYPILVANPDTSIRYINPALEELTGFSLNELIGQKLPRPWWPEELREKLEREAKSAYNRGFKNREHCFQKKSGEQFWVQVTASPLTIGGKFQHFIDNWVDITERKKAEEALRESEEFNSSVLRNAPYPILVANPDTSIRYVNPALEELTGFSLNEIIGKKMPRPWWPEEFLEKIEQDAKIGYHRGFRTREHRYQKKSGEQFWAQVTATPVFIDGKFRHFIGNWVDITERKRMEEELVRSRDYLARLNDSMTDMVFDVKLPERTVQYVNKAVETILGYTQEECMGQSIEMIYPDQKESHKVGMRMLRGAERGNEIVTSEHQFMKKDGTVIFVEGRTNFLRDDDKVVTALTTVRDITERKRMEEALADEATRRRILVEQSRDGIVILDQNGKVFEANRRFSQMLGYSPEETLELHVWDWDTQWTKEQLLEMIGSVGTAGDHFETYHRRKDGTVYDVAISTNGATIAGQKLVFCVCRDITERKRAEEALRESEEKYRLLVENQTDLVVKVNTEGEFQFVSPSYCEMFGTTEDELLGKKLMPLANEDDRDITAKTMQSLYQPPYTCQVEQRALTKHGWRWLSWSDSAVLDENKNVVSIIGVGRDITERKEAEEEYQTIIRTTMDGFWLIDSQGHFLDVNDVYCRMIGYSRDELLNMSISDIEALEQPEETAGRIRKIKEVGFDRFETRHRRKDGEIIDVEISVNYLPTEEERLLVFARDITERKAAVDALRESEERYRALIDLGSRVGEAVVMLQDAEDKLAVHVFVNDEWPRITGYSREELSTMSMLDLIHPRYRKDSTERHWKRMSGEVIPDLLDISIVRKDGAEVPVEATYAHTTYKGDLAYVGYIREITERKRVEEEHQRATKLESLGTLAGGIAHDFNNMLTGILGNVSLARRYVEPDSKAAERLGEAEKASIRARDLTQQLLTFSRGGAPVKRTVFIGQLLVDTTRFALRGSNVREEFSLTDNIWPVDIDEGQIGQVLTNLIINACEAMLQGGILKVGTRNLLAKEIRSLKLEPGKYIEITVSDHGTGIAPEHVGRVFEPYFTTKPKGSGLGLATVYSVIKNHGGHITMESEVGKGTTFNIYLPASQKPIATTDETPGDTPIVGRGKLLVMDDEDIIREFLYHELTDVGYDVTITSDGAEAIEQYEKAKDKGGPFDAVILDLTVSGGIGGKEAISRLREIDPKVKAIASSGYANDPIMANHRKYGFRAVVAKPYRVGELEKTLQDILKPKR